MASNKGKFFIEIIKRIGRDIGLVCVLLIIVGIIGGAVYGVGVLIRHFLGDVGIFYFLIAFLVIYVLVSVISYIRDVIREAKAKANWESIKQDKGN